MMLQSAPWLVALFTLASAQPAAAQPDSWEKAQALAPGPKIQLLLPADKTVVGTLAEVTPDGLTVARKRDSTQVAKSDIRRIWVLGKGSRLKNAGIAALIGFAGGCPFGAARAGYLSDMDNPSVETRAGFCLALGGVVAGAAGGITAAVPATKRTLVYRSPEPKR